MLSAPSLHRVRVPCRTQDRAEERANFSIAGRICGAFDHYNEVCDGSVQVGPLSGAAYFPAQLKGQGITAEQ